MIRVQWPAATGARRPSPWQPRRSESPARRRCPAAARPLSRPSSGARHGREPGPGLQSASESAMAMMIMIAAAGPVGMTRDHVFGASRDSESAVVRVYTRAVRPAATYGQSLLLWTIWNIS